MKTTVTSENEMAPHFRKAVAEIDADVAQLQSDVQELLGARAAIVKLYGGDTELNVPSAATAVKAFRKPRAAKLAEAGPKLGLPLTGTPAPLRVTGDTVKLLAAMRVAAEPFTMNSLCVETAFEKKFVSNGLMRAKTNGWIEGVARGTYKRTGSFPATTE